MSKKAQAQIITTVLIILLVLAAIVIVWQVISGTVETGTNQLESQSGCIGASLDIESAVEAAGSNSVTVRVKRGADSSDITGILLIIEDPQGNRMGSKTFGTTLVPEKLGIGELTIEGTDLDALTGGDSYVAKIAPQMGADKNQCDVADSQTFDAVA